MDNGFSILMLIFGIALLLYAGLLYATGSPDLLPYKAQFSLQRKDQKGQVRRIAKITAVCALTPLIGGIAGAAAGKNLACIIAGLLTAAVSVIAAILRHRNKRSGSGNE